MNTNKTRLSLLTIALLVIASCSKDNTPASVAPDKAKLTFSSVNTDLASEVGGLNSAPGNVALSSFSSLNNTTSPFGRITSYKNPGDIRVGARKGLAAVRQMLVKTTSGKREQDNVAFNFAQKVGTYAWDNVNQEWDYTSGGTIIKIDYPKDADNHPDINDAELQISAYDETVIGSDYYPTNIQAAIYISQVKELGLGLTAGYDGDGIPNQGTISLFVNPYTISLGFDDSQPVSGTESFGFSKSNKVLIEMSFTASYASALDKENNNPPSAVTGHLTLENIRFDLTENGANEGTATSYNDFIVIVVTIDGGVAGHVVWVGDQGDEQPYIKYNNNDTDPLETVFADLKEQVDALG